jgi:hypothetical protein
LRELFAVRHGRSPTARGLRCSDAVLRSVAALVVLFVAMLGARDASAVGTVLGGQATAPSMLRARFAVVVSPSATTRWASIELDAFPGAMAWLIPVRPGAKIAETSDAWFEALELATAPRIVPSVCATPSGGARTAGLADRVPTVPSLENAVVDDVPALRAWAAARALEVPSDVEGRFETLRERGYVLAAFLYAGPAAGGFTRTVRVTDDAFPNVPLFMTLGAKVDVRVTAFLIADQRARLGAGEEIEIDPSAVTWSADGSDDYDRRLERALVAGAGRSWVVESAEPDLFLAGARRPGGLEVTPPIAPTYDARAASYGDHAIDVTLAVGGRTDDDTWVTRAAGIVPAATFGDDVAVTLAPGALKSPFVVNAGTTCEAPATVTMDPPVMSTSGGPPLAGNSPARGNAPTRGAGAGRGQTTTMVPAPQVSVNASGSCDGSPSSSSGSESDSEDTSSDDSCDHSDTSDASSSDDGCDSHSDSSSDSAKNDSSDGCDSGSHSDTSSSDGCSGGGGGSSNESCSLSRRSRRGRPRTSLVLWSACAVLLSWRRAQRRRARDARC